LEISILNAFDRDDVLVYLNRNNFHLYVINKNYFYLIVKIFFHGFFHGGASGKFLFTDRRLTGSIESQISLAPSGFDVCWPLKVA
jgi:hypothetical protein